MVASDGWAVNESVLATVFGDDPVPKERSMLLKQLEDFDIKSFGLPSLADQLSTSNGVLRGPIVLQISRIRNVSYPKVSESNQQDGIIRLTLTDGHGSVAAIIVERFKEIGSETKPGTKLLLTGNIQFESGFLILKKTNCKVLGGKVDELVEQWIIEKNSMFKEDRSAKSNAPKWIPFGKRGADAAATRGGATKGFKANEVVNAAKKAGGAGGTEDKEGDDNFELQRKQQIEAIAADAVKKKFAAPQIVPPPQKQQMSTEEYEQNALKKQKEREMKADRGHDRRQKGRRGRRDGSDDEGEVPAEFARPSAPATLFDFVASNVPESFLAKATSSGPQERSAPSYEKRFDNGRNSDRQNNQRFDQRNDARGQGREQGNRGGFGKSGARDYDKKGGRSEYDSAREQGPRGGDRHQGTSGGTARPQTAREQGAPRYQDTRDQGNRGGRGGGGARDQGQRGERRDFDNNGRQQENGGGQRNFEGARENGNRGDGRQQERRDNGERREFRPHQQSERQQGGQRGGPYNAPAPQSQSARGGNSFNRMTENFGNLQVNPSHRSGPVSSHPPDFSFPPPGVAGRPMRGGPGQGPPPPSFNSQVPMNNMQGPPPARGAQQQTKKSPPPPQQQPKGGNEKGNDGKPSGKRTGEGTWNVGDQCLAPWDDGQIYVATVIYVGPGNMCKVKYDEYGNTTTLPQGVLIVP